MALTRSQQLELINAKINAIFAKHGVTVERGIEGFEAGIDKVAALPRTKEDTAKLRVLSIKWWGITELGVEG